MVDISTYRQLHADSAIFRRKPTTDNTPNRANMDPEVMIRDEPPSAPEIFVFPDKIPGYNLRTKRWRMFKGTP